MCGASSPQSERGFSLVEVLCALAIAAAAIVLLMRGTLTSLAGSSALNMHLGARVLLETIIDDELSAVTTAAERREGESGPYRWRLSITPVAGHQKLSAPFRMYRLEASASWSKGGSMTAVAVKLSR